MRPSKFLLVVSVRRQEVWLFQKAQLAVRGGSPAFLSARTLPARNYVFRRRYLASTSRVGVGQQSGSNRTPLGLHRVGEKVGAGHPVGTVFESRQPVGFIWQGHGNAAIAHRILWLEGLEAGFNRGGEVDSRARYIYIHGLGDELTLGRPASRGCVHLSGTDLIPLFDLLPVGTLVWIQP